MQYNLYTTYFVQTPLRIKLRFDNIEKIKIDCVHVHREFEGYRQSFLLLHKVFLVAFVTLSDLNGSTFKQPAV